MIILCMAIYLWLFTVPLFWQHVILVNKDLPLTPHTIYNINTQKSLIKYKKNVSWIHNCAWKKKAIINVAWKIYKMLTISV